MSKPVTRHFKSGSVVFREGDPGRHLYIIQSGEVCLVQGAGASNRVISTLGPGDFFGELSIINNRNRESTAEVASDAKLLEVDARTFESMISSNVEIAVRVIRKLASQLDQAELAQAGRAGVRGRQSTRQTVLRLVASAGSRSTPAPAGELADAAAADSWDAERTIAVRPRRQPPTNRRTWYIWVAVLSLLFSVTLILVFVGAPKEPPRPAAVHVVPSETVVAPLAPAAESAKAHSEASSNAVVTAADNAPPHASAQEAVSGRHSPRLRKRRRASPVARRRLVKRRSRRRVRRPPKRRVAAAPFAPQSTDAAAPAATTAKVPVPAVGAAAKKPETATPNVQPTPAVEEAKKTAPTILETKAARVPGKAAPPKPKKAKPAVAKRNEMTSRRKRKPEPPAPIVRPKRQPPNTSGGANEDSDVPIGF